MNGLFKMAQVQDRKSEIYRQKQSIRDESSAPQYLETAGDVLIKNLAKKQLQTSTTLKEQLELVQNFEKGHELNADLRSGITSLKDFQKDNVEENSPHCSSISEKPNDIDELMKITGLSRQELELSLCEKPNSEISQLYRFAIVNKKSDKSDCIEKKLPNHPINRLKEIEEECFGHLKKKIHKLTSTSDEDEDNDKKEVKSNKKKKNHRKRRKKSASATEIKNTVTKKSEVISSQGQLIDKNLPETSCGRPSLWDVKDMKKWSSSKVQGCSPKTLYTIKNGKIIKLGEKIEGGDVT